MSHSETRLGELLLFIQTILWSLFPVITILTFSAFTPMQSAAMSTLLSSVFFGFMITTRHRWHELLVRAAWKPMAVTTLMIGIFFYAFFFIGLTHTTAGNASIMALMEVFFSFLILSVLSDHEPLLGPHLAGALLMVLGAIVALMPQATGWHSGDALIVAATAFAPVGNLAMKKARRLVSAETILFVRSIASGSVLLLLSGIAEPLPSVESFRAGTPLLLVNGIIFLGFTKILWVEAAHRIPITKAISLSSITPLFTFLFAYIFLDERMTFLQIGGLIPIMLGIRLLTRNHSSRNGHTTPCAS